MASQEHGSHEDTVVAFGLSTLSETCPLASTSATTLGPIPFPKSASELLQGLVRQTQLLACLQWLGKFQILAYVPLTDTLAYNDLADLAGVPPSQIRRIVRMAATVGILCEPQPGHVAHTPLSAQIYKKPSYLDAVRFTAETVVPTSLRMADATRRKMQHHQEDANPFRIATDSSLSLASACERDHKLHRRAITFRRLTSVNRTSAVLEMLSSVNLEELGQTVVDVNSTSTAIAKSLRCRNPSLHFVVQMHEGTKQKTESACSSRRFETSGWLEIQNRAHGTTQNETNAAVYLLHVPDPFFYASSGAHAEVCVAELRAHFDMLRTNETATVILIADVVPERSGGDGSPDGPAAARARLNDLLLLQAGHDVVFDVKRLRALLEFAREGSDRVTVVKQLSSASHSSVAFVLRSRSLSSSGPFPWGHESYRVSVRNETTSIG
ncbi:Putative O-methyltransferase COMT-type, winged helix-like DNA-binding domain superfamily [Colletotrichum destructivum]|uniref:O-methyltransferase COMT-type, winged helix-like DNA-binding domain superfamily n=1 Tax=Colletotrichum destructivum TaxID=34406 RepID=A0AAX4IZ34_9PEZI|nr:Putative O-methyltransferase COMT-type, winged helix-like DNA-binding domain superfamily [Colletotrichum destructivum]